jgi:Rho GDP-dissociation inhibitor
MAGDHDDDLTVEHTEGFKVGEKKTMEEYHQLGARLSFVAY